MQQIISQVADRTGVATWKVKNTIGLLSEGATIPFISRYRKESIGSIDEVSVSEISKEFKRLSDLASRKEFIINTIRDQDKLTDELATRIEHCWDPTLLEDLYLPFKPKRKTRATKAREAGLEPMARIIMKQHEPNPSGRAAQFISDAYPDIPSVIAGAQDIMAEWIVESPNARNAIRLLFDRKAHITCKLIKGKEAEGQKYRDYFDFEEPLKKCPSHRLLAIRRGEDEGILRVSIQPDKEEALQHLERIFVRSNNQSGSLVRAAVEDAYKRLLSSSIETEFRNSSKAKADVEAIDVFAKNLRQLLLSPPLGKKRVLAIDPGFRSGCKLVCLDEHGKFLKNETIYPDFNDPRADSGNAVRTAERLVRDFRTKVVAIGSGTAGRETESWIRTVLGPGLDVYLISEDGASVYSASEIARAEFPNLDLTVRGAISIGRRLLDPLAELVKIDPKSIGVGQYQHDVDQKLLRERLDEVVMSCVNSVGVNLNTASVQLLAYVSGIGNATAEHILAYREENGPFTKRSDLKKVKGIGPKAFEQCAGFLRIPGAGNPLDNSAVHPERYALVQQIASDLKVPIKELVGNDELINKIDLGKYVSEEVGLPTLKDIIAELKKPGLDPRGEVQVFSFAEDVRTIDDLREGMILPGKITNITKFGAFVDIGIKENGLVHISQLANKYVSDPSDVVSLNQQVQVKVMEVDKERGRVGLSMKI